MNTVPSITLDNGVEIPQLGLGVWQVEDAIVADVVTTAIKGLDLRYPEVTEEMEKRLGEARTALAAEE